MYSPSHTIPQEAHSPECWFWGRTTQWNDGRSLFEFWWHKRYELFVRFPPVDTQVPRIFVFRPPDTSTCIFCRWIQVCYWYKSRQSICLGYQKQCSFKNIHGVLPATLWWPTCTISSIQQWKVRKRSFGICRGTFDVYILISLCLKYAVWILSAMISPLLESFMWSMRRRLRRKKFFPWG